MSEPVDGLSKPAPIEQAPGPQGREVVVNGNERGLLSMICLYAGPRGYQDVVVTESDDRREPGGTGELAPDWHRMIIQGPEEDAAFVEALLWQTEKDISDRLTAEQTRRKAAKVAGDMASAGADAARTVATAGATVARQGLAGLARRVLAASEPKS